jgi:hypothetical protein
MHRHIAVSIDSFNADFDFRHDRTSSDQIVDPHGHHKTRWIDFAATDPMMVEESGLFSNTLPKPNTNMTQAVGHAEAKAKR